MNKQAETKVGKSFEELTPEEMNKVQGSFLFGWSWSSSSSSSSSAASSSSCYSSRCSYSCCSSSCCKWY